MHGEKVQLLQSQLTLSEADSGFEWSRLQETEIEHPTPVSTYIAALDELVKALEGNATLRNDGCVGRRSLEMVNAVYQS
jgi:murein L,D-transpeptidase YcbB/YkuD